jgi:hypothetical protein
MREITDDRWLSVLNQTALPVPLWAMLPLDSVCILMHSTVWPTGARCSRGLPNFAAAIEDMRA